MITLVGNQDNNAYRLARWMRELGVDVSLVLFASEERRRSWPELVDPELTHGYPDWCYVESGPTSILRNRFEVIPALAARSRSVLTSGFSGLRAAHHLRGLPVYHLCLGSEITRAPWRSPWQQGSLYDGLAQVRLRANVKRMRGIFVQSKRAMEALREAGLADKIIEWGIPDDVHGNRQRMDSAHFAELCLRFDAYDRVFVWLARLNMDPASDEYKAPERFLDALARLRADGLGERRVCAIVIRHGADVERFTALAGERGVADLIQWIPHQPFTHVLAYLALPNAIVVDSLARQAVPGGLSREAICMGAALVRMVDANQVARVFGPGFPAVPAGDVDECVSAFVDLLDDDQLRARQDDTRSWAERFLHYPKNLGRMLDILAPGRVA